MYSYSCVSGFCWLEEVCERVWQFNSWFVRALGEADQIGRKENHICVEDVAHMVTVPLHREQYSIAYVSVGLIMGRWLCILSLKLFV